MKNTIQLFDKTFEVLISRLEIEAMVNRMAEEINQVYGSEEVTIIGVLDGSCIFMADLVRRLYFPLKMEFVKLKSYDDYQSTGNVQTILSLQANIKDKHVLVVEDIIDTGLTIDYFLEDLRSQNPKSLRICTLLSKPEVHNDIIPIDFLGKEIDPTFVIGYGLDINGYARQFPDIYQLIGTTDDDN